MPTLPRVGKPGQLGSWEPVPCHACFSLCQDRRLTSLGELWQSGRLCVAVSPADKPSKGVMLGSSGGVLYLEPPAAVPLNNELAAARGEANAAEEAVLWRVTGLIVDAEEDVRRALELVRLHSAELSTLAKSRPEVSNLQS